MRVRGMFACLALAGCGGEHSVGVDAARVPATLNVSGHAEAYSASGSQPLAGVTVAAYRSSDDATVVVSTTTGVDGRYNMVLETGGQPLDGYFRATLSTYMDTYLYPARVVSEDLTGARIAMLTPEIFTLLSDTLCGADQQASNAAIIAIVTDETETPVAGAIVGSSPAAPKYCYNSGGFPNRNAAATDADGIAYYLDVPPGRVTVSAVRSGLTLPTHSVMARGGVLTTTLIEP